MPNLYQVLRELESIYLNETSSTERYMILQAVEEKMKELRAETMRTMVDKDYTLENHNLEKLRKIFSYHSNLHIDVINEYVVPEATLYFLTNEFMLDSLDLIEIIMSIEDEFDIEIDDHTAEGFRSINDILRVLTK